MYVYYSSMASHPSVGPSSLLQFRNLTQTVALLGRVSSPLQGRYLYTERTHRHPSFWVGFEHTIPAFERTKTVHALDRAATVIGLCSTSTHDFTRLASAVRYWNEKQFLYIRRQNYESTTYIFRKSVFIHHFRLIYKHSTVTPTSRVCVTMILLVPDSKKLNVTTFSLVCWDVMKLSLLGTGVIIWPIVPTTNDE
jgi:hypothetical protein